VVEVDLLATRAPAVSPVLAVLFVFAFGFYATVEASALYARAVTAETDRPAAPAVLESESAALYAHVCYVWVCALLLSWAIVKNDGVNLRRLGLFGFYISLSAIVTMVTQVFFVTWRYYVYSIVPQLVYTAVHATLAAMTLFFMHSAGGVEYKDLGNEAPGAAHRARYRADLRWR
jgi:hypothetical protein